jgi:hypothetical protein
MGYQNCQCDESLSEQILYVGSDTNGGRYAEKQSIVFMWVTRLPKQTILTVYRHLLNRHGIIMLPTPSHC